MTAVSRATAVAWLGYDPAVTSASSWVLLAYRLPREPSTPRIAVWRAVRRLGAVRVLDGLVALPADARTREQMEWLAETVVEAGGESSVWLGRPGSLEQEQALAARMQDAVDADYGKVRHEALAALVAPAGQRKRTLGRLRRELRRVRRRDYFGAPGRPAAAAAVESLGDAVQEAAA